MAEKQYCKACGSASFVQGEIGHGYANVRPVGKVFTNGIPLLLEICTQCGEVSSFKVKDINKL